MGMLGAFAAAGFVIGLASTFVRDLGAGQPGYGALFAAVWVRGLHVSDAAVLERVADEAGLNGAALVYEATSAECKARLREQTDSAIARGVFGVPTIAAGDELFWGYDDLPHLELFLAGKDPLDAAEWQKWAAASPKRSAQRRSSGTERGSERRTR